MKSVKQQAARHTYYSWSTALKSSILTTHYQFFKFTEVLLVVVGGVGLGGGGRVGGGAVGIVMHQSCDFWTLSSTFFPCS